MTVKIVCFRCQHPDWTSCPLAETGEATSLRGFLTAHGGKSVGNMGWGGQSRVPPLRVHRGLGVGETGVGLPIRAILRVKARVFNESVEICGLAYGRGTSVASLFGCCARRATRLREAEKTGSLVSTELDESTPREERYGGGGTNGVYY